MNRGAAVPEFQDPGTPTHEPLDVDAVWDLGEKIDELCPDGLLSHEKLASIAAGENVPLSHIYTAAAFDPDYRWERAHERQIVVCLGACQAWGAGEIVEKLFELRQERLDAGGPGFDIVSVACLDRCMTPAAADTQGPDGAYQHAGLRVGIEEELVAALCD
jgi:hypothetical protein